MFYKSYKHAEIFKNHLDLIANLLVLIRTNRLNSEHAISQLYETLITVQSAHNHAK